MKKNVLDVIKKYLFLTLSIVFLFYIFFIFNNKTNGIEYETQTPITNLMMKTASYSQDGVMLNTNSSSSKLIKTFQITIEIKNNINIKSIIDDELDKYNGIIENFNSYSYHNDELAYDFKIKLPVEKANDFITYIKTLGIVKSENSSTSDVIEQYQDNKNRLENLYIRRDRLRQMMKVKTEKLADIIAVDRELSNVQLEIERLEKNNQTIDRNVEYSTLNLSVLPEVKIQDLRNQNWQFNTSWTVAVNKLILFTQKTIDFTFTSIVFSPIIILAFALFYIVNKYRKKN